MHHVDVAVSFRTQIVLQGSSFWIVLTCQFNQCFQPEVEIVIYEFFGHLGLRQSELQYAVVATHIISLYICKNINKVNNIYWFEAISNLQLSEVRIWTKPAEVMNVVAVWIFQWVLRAHFDTASDIFKCLTQ